MGLLALSGCVSQLFYLLWDWTWSKSCKTEKKEGIGLVWVAFLLLLPAVVCLLHSAPRPLAEAPVRSVCQGLLGRCRWATFSLLNPTGWAFSWAACAWINRGVAAPSSGDSWLTGSADVTLPCLAAIWEECDSPFLQRGGGNWPRERESKCTRLRRGWYFLRRAPGLSRWILS